MPDSIKGPLATHGHEFKVGPIGKIVCFVPSIHSHMDMNTELLETWILKRLGFARKGEIYKGMNIMMSHGI